MPWMASKQDGLLDEGTGWEAAYTLGSKLVHLARSELRGRQGGEFYIGNSKYLWPMK